jgi:ATP-binding cassette subfamily B protein
LAQVAAALVDGLKRVSLDAGPIHAHASISTLLVAGFALAAVRLLLQSVIVYLPARFSADSLYALRSSLFGAYSRASWPVQSRDRQGELQEMMSGQSMAAATASYQAAILVTAILAFSVLAASALVLDPLAAVLVLAAAGGLFALLRPVSVMGGRRTHLLALASVNLAEGISEATRLAEETNVFGVADAHEERVMQHVHETRNLFFQNQLLAGVVPGVYQSAIYLMVVGGLAILYASGTHQIASLGAVVLVLVRAGTYGQIAQTTYQNVRQTIPYVERVLTFEQRFVDEPYISGGTPLQELRTIAFDHVTFGYDPRRPVLTDVTFEVECGQAIGVVGPSGAGKSTTSQLLLRLRQPNAGRYLVNGAPAEAFRASDWRRLVAYVPQDPSLLHASAADNIRYFRDFGPVAVERAARLAGIHEEIMSWPDGYDTLIGPRADAVSGGQEQRICLARALVAEPTMLVLDEPTSALDPHSEKLIQNSLEVLKGQVTLFIVAHRLTTLQLCDRLMVIRDGRLEAIGSTEELSADNEYFQSASTLASATPGRRD